MSWPSLPGFNPSSDFWIAFSTALMIVRSQGWIRIMRASGTVMVASWFKGVGFP